MKLLVDDTSTHRLFMDKTEAGIKRWTIEDKENQNIKIFNGLWYKQEQVVKVLRSL